MLTAPPQQNTAAANLRCSSEGQLRVRRKRRSARKRLRRSAKLVYVRVLRGMAWTLLVLEEAVRATGLLGVVALALVFG